MADRGDDDKKRKFREHPILANLRPDPNQESEPTVRLTGYLGRSHRQGCVRLYTSLDDLSQFVDIKEADVVHVEDVPESVMEHGGSSLWVKSAAELTYSQVQTETVQAQFVAGGIAQRHLQDLPQVGLDTQLQTQTIITFRVTCFATCRVVTCFRTCTGVTCAATCIVTCFRTCNQITCNRTCQVVTCFRTCQFVTCGPATCFATCFRTCICEIEPFPTQGCPFGGGNPSGGGDPFGGGGGIGGF